MTEDNEHNDRIDVRSHDIVSDEIEKLLEIFPSVRSEDGRVNFEALKAALGAEVVEGVERFGMSWPGKAESIRAAQKQSVATLLPVEDESVDFDTTQNVIIEGDNLEVLKLLQKSYLGKVKMIYIDPPYNTGNDFIYPDNYSESLQTYLEYTRQVDDEGKRFSTNTETDGRFHSKWMSMMYPRLMLARNLLTEDGVIFISIDDNELTNLSSIVETIFGPQNLINVVAVKSSESSGVKMSHADRRLPKIKEYILVVARSHEHFRIRPVLIPKSGADLNKYLKYYSSVIEDPTKPVEKWKIVGVKEYMKKLKMEVSDDAIRDFKVANADRVVYRTNNRLLSELSFSSTTARVLSPTGIEYIWWEGKQMLFLRDYLSETACDLWIDISTINLAKEMNGIDCFNNGQKPLALLERLLHLSSDGRSDIVLDFFAGSGTTGHAVLAQNAKDGGSRRFILVQLPEPVEEGSEAAKAGFGTIADITKERVRRAAKEIAKEAGGASKLKLADGSGRQDLGFRVFKLDKSNFRVWDAAAPAGDEAKLAEQLRLQVEHVEKGREGLDVVFEVLLKSKLPLTSKVEKAKVSGGEVWSVESGRLLVVVDLGVDLAGVRELAKRDPKPETVVFLDRCFGGKDSLKANARKIFEDASIEFRTI